MIDPDDVAVVAAQLAAGTVIGLLATHVAVAPYLAQDVG